MQRRALCIHDDARVRACAEGLDPAFATDAVGDVDAGAARHARSPFDVVLVQLDHDVAVLRELRSWHPEPAVVALLDDEEQDVEVALTAGAHDHAPERADAETLTAAAERAWRRHRADRTHRPVATARPDATDVQLRITQLVSLAAAAKDLLDIDEPPHVTVRSLLDQARELGEETVELTGGQSAADGRERLDLEALVQAAWRGRAADHVEVETRITDIEVHGQPAMVRTALAVVLSHALRGDPAARRIIIETVPTDAAVRIRVHDDGPAVPLGRRPALFVGGADGTAPALMAVQHVAAQHGGAAWLADSDLLDDGTVAVIELPVRALPR